MTTIQPVPAKVNLRPTNVRPQLPAKPERYVKTPESLLFERPDLTPTEALCIQAVMFHDWFGIGCHPSNETLMKACRIKDLASMTRLVSGLQRRGYFRIELVEQTKANPTGRIIHITLPSVDATTEPPRLHETSRPLFDDRWRNDPSVQGAPALRRGTPRVAGGPPAPRRGTPAPQRPEVDIEETDEEK